MAPTDGSADAGERAPLLARPVAAPARDRGGDAPGLGYALMALSTVGFAGMTFAVHLLGAPAYGLAVPPLLTVWARAVVQLALSAVYAAAVVDVRAVVAAVTPRRAGLLAARGAAGTLGFLCLFQALALLPLGDAVTLFFTGPLWTALLARATLGERVPSVEAAAAVVSFAGVALVAQPALPGGGGAAATGASLGIVLALTAALLSAVAYTLVRKLGGGVHFILNVVALGVCSAALTTVWLGRALPKMLAEAAQSRAAVGLLLFQGVSAFFGQCCLNKALQHCGAAAVVLRNLDVPAGYLLGMLIGEVPNWRATIGALLVVGATALITFRQVARGGR